MAFTGAAVFLGPSVDGKQEPAFAVPATGAGAVLHVTDLGIIVGSPVGPVPEVRSLLSWAALVGVEVVGSSTLPDGTPGAVVQIESVEGSWLERSVRGRIVVPASDLAAFLAAVAAGQHSIPPAESGTDRLGPADRSGRIAALAAAVMALANRPVLTKEGEPQHGLGRRRFAPVAVGLLALLLLAGSSRIFEPSAGGVTSRTDSYRTQTPDVGNKVEASSVKAAAVLPAATAPPAPAPPSVAASAPLQSHEVFGYAPYWTLPQSSGFDVQDLTTLAYFSVDANPDGTLDESGPGWNGYESQDLADLVTRSHAAGDRVVLTVTCFSQSALDAITSDPSAAANLSAALISAVSAKNLDGVNFDFEGQGSADRTGLTALITQVSNALHAANPHWQVTMATYASAAGDSAGFYDVAALAPAVDGFFVMAYDMNSQTTPSATSPLTGGGFTDLEALQQFTSVVPASKVILGVPFYGYDWPTTDGTPTAQATGAESPLSDAVIQAAGHPTYWDPTTQTPWTSYQVGTQWHETFFDDPTSLALKAQLANLFHVAGVGIWALGMDGNNPADIAALLGNAPAVKDFQAGPTSTGLPGAGYVTSGMWNGTNVSLTPVAPLTSEGTGQYLGTLGGIQSTAPTLSCLETGSPLNVWTFSSVPGVDVAVATQPINCVGAFFSFTPPATPTTTTTTTTSPTTTTTTTPPTTTTAPPTTTTDPSSTTSTTS